MFTTNNEELFSSATFENNVQVVKHIDLFRHLKQSDWFNIAARFEKIKIDADDIIYKEGDDVDFFFIILEGKVIISKLCQTSSVEQKELSQGTYFGLTSVYFGGKARATAKAATNITCLYMDKKSFEETILPVLREIERICQAYQDFISSM